MLYDEYLFPFSPADNKNEPIEDACPMQRVDTGEFMYCIVS